MKILVVADGHYHKNDNGEVFAESTYDYTFYKRYLDVFDEVYAIVRMKEGGEVPKNSKPCNGENVHFLPVPASKGVVEYFKSAFKTRALIKEYIKDFDCAIFRVTGVIPNAVERQYRKTKKTYAAEVVVDPWEYFAKGTVTGITRPFIRFGWRMALKRICKKANGASYVTERYLQQRYPSRLHLGDKTGFTESYSSVELPDDTFASPRTHTKKDKIVISHVANSFSTYGKGHLPLMRAIKELKDRGYNLEAVFVGDGPLKPKFEEFAKELGIFEDITFTGRLANGNEVRKVIKNSDIFVFPTRAEGLPRVVLEAMAEGLPVISSPVCGIPEVLQKSCLVEYEDSKGYADTIERLINNPEEMDKLSEENLSVAHKFSSSRLQEKRIGFYKKLRECAEKNGAV